MKGIDIMKATVYYKPSLLRDSLDRESYKGIQLYKFFQLELEKYILGFYYLVTINSDMKIYLDSVANIRL